MRFSLPLAVAVTALAGATLGTTALASAANDLDTSKIFSQDADTMLRQIGAARQAIRTDNIAGAKGDLAKAESAHDSAVATANAKHSSMVVPIYGELVQDSVIDQVGPMHGTGAMKNPAPASSTAPGRYTVGGNTADLTYVAVDLKKSGDRLAAARKALDDGNKEAAMDTLAAIGSDFVVESQAADLPLLTARQNLAIAHDALAAGHQAQAKAAVAAASAALKRYSSEPGMHATDARKLSADLDAFGTGSPANTGSPNAIEAWWNSVTGWFKEHA